MDVKNEFIHDISDNIYMEQPEGFIQDSSLICKLKEDSLWTQGDPKSMVCQDGLLPIVLKHYDVSNIQMYTIL